MASALVKWWVEFCDAVAGGRLSRRLRPDDHLFVAMLAAWVILDGLVSCALLGWSGVGVLLAAGGLVAVVAIAVQSREREPRRAAEPS